MASAGLVLSVPLRETVPCSHLGLPASLASLAYRGITPDCLVLHMEFSFVHTCVLISSLYNDTIYTGLTSLGKLTSQTVKNLPAMRETWIRSLGQEDPLEEGMATHSSILAWRIPWTGETGGLQSTGSQRVGHD